MTINFYNVKTRSTVEVPLEQVKKIIYIRKTSKGNQERYALRAKVDGTNVTKFVSKQVYDETNVPVEE